MNITSDNPTKPIIQDDTLQFGFLVLQGLSGLFLLALFALPLIAIAQNYGFGKALFFGFTGIVFLLPVAIISLIPIAGQIAIINFVNQYVSWIYSIYGVNIEINLPLVNVNIQQYTTTMVIAYSILASFSNTVIYAVILFFIIKYSSLSNKPD